MYKIDERFYDRIDASNYLKALKRELARKRYLTLTEVEEDFLPDEFILDDRYEFTPDELSGSTYGWRALKGAKAIKEDDDYWYVYLPEPAIL